ncbi:hypothetical protein ABZR88_17600 [Mucilaginibacter yixingensis]|nr:hypothetical protein [Mucilaginibacter yixingensis]
MVGVALQKKLLAPKDYKYIGIFSVIYIAFVAIRDPFINSLDNTFLLGDVIFLFKYCYLSFLFCIILKDKAAAYLVKVITHLTIISFFFYALQLIVPDLVYDVFRKLELPNDNVLTNNLAGSYSNVLLFTFTKDFHDYTNSGFVWEPGSFGCFLCLALMLNFFLNRFTFDRTSVILIIGNLTTFSTTAYTGLIVLLFLAYRYRVPKINLWAFLAIGLIVLLVCTVPILGRKMVDMYNEDMADLNHLKVLEHFYHHYRMQIPLNRFASMVYIYSVFGWQLILGVSNKYSLIFYRKFNVNVSNGIFDFLAKFGFVGLLYLFYKYAKFCKAYVKNWEYVFYCIAMLFLIGFGEPVMILPIILNFLFLSVTQTSIVKTATDNKRSREEYRKYLQSVPAHAQ